MTRHDADAWFQKGLDALEMSRSADHQSEYLGDLGDAAAAFEEATRCAPDHAEAWLQLGLALSSLDSHERALAAFTEVIRLRPDDLEAWFRRAAAFTALGRDEETVAACGEVLQRVTDDVAAWHLRMVALVNLNRHEETLAACEKILGSHGEVAHGSGPLGYLKLDARLHRAGALARLGQSADARVAFADAFRAGQREQLPPPAYYKMLAGFEEARAGYRDLLLQTPGRAAAWLRSGSEFARAGRPAEALEAYETAIRLGPGNPNAWWGKAEALVQSGRIEESIPAFRKTLELWPGFPGIAGRLDYVLKQLAASTAQTSAPAAGGAETGKPVERPRETGATAGRDTRSMTLPPRKSRKKKAELAVFHCAVCRLPAASAALGMAEAVVVRVFPDPHTAAFEALEVPVAGEAQPEASRSIRSGIAAQLHDLDERFVPLYCPACAKTYCIRHWTADFSSSERLHTCPDGHVRSMPPPPTKPPVEGVSTAAQPRPVVVKTVTAKELDIDGFFPNVVTIVNVTARAMTAESRPAAGLQVGGRRFVPPWQQARDARRHGPAGSIDPGQRATLMTPSDPGGTAHLIEVRYQLLGTAPVTHTYDLSKWDFGRGTRTGTVRACGDWLSLPLVLLRGAEIVCFNNTSDAVEVSSGTGEHLRASGVLDPRMFATLGEAAGAFLDVEFVRFTNQERFYAPHQDLSRSNDPAAAPAVKLRFALRPEYDEVVVPGLGPARLILPDLFSAEAPALDGSSRPG